MSQSFVQDWIQSTCLADNIISYANNCHIVSGNPWISKLLYRTDVKTAKKSSLDVKLLLCGKNQSKLLIIKRP